MDHCLVAYVVAHPEFDMTTDALSTFVAERLPQYMQPAVYVLKENLPQTEVGKVDRAALADLAVPDMASAEYIPPQTATEQILAGIWAELFHRARISRFDNFFQLGGHSLLAIRLVARLRQALGTEAGIKDLFSSPILADLARHLESAPKIQLPPITRAERAARMPLSFAQQRLWFVAQMEGGREAYHMGYSLRLQGAVHTAALRRALDTIVQRHEALRTTFVVHDGNPEQRITSAHESHFHLLEHDLRHYDNQHDEGQRLRIQELCAPFDLKHGPLFRGRLIRYADEDYTLLLTMHHIVSDGWSVGILMQELSVLYSAYVRGEAALLPELTMQYFDYAMWQRQWMGKDLLRQQAEYWKLDLRDAPEVLELPADHPRPPQQSFSGAFTELVLNPKITAGLKELSQRCGTTLYMTLLAGWTALLSRVSGQHDVVVGTPTANRGRVEIENLIGFFVNTLALRVDLSGSPTVHELLERVRRQALAAQQHQDIPFEQVVEIVQASRSVAYSPLFQTMFAWQNIPKRTPALLGLNVSSIESAPHLMSKFDLMLTLRESEDRIVGGVEYATALFEPATMARYAGYFLRILEGMIAADEAQEVERLPILGETEWNQVLYGFNDTAIDYPAGDCVHQLFEEQVKKTPEAIAVMHEDGTLSYEEVNRRANQLAHYLREAGVGPDARVGLCVPRGCAMVIALLAILKAGGAFIPLDPAYPPEQLRYLLKDSAPIVLLTVGELRALFRDSSQGVLLVDVASSPAAWKDRPTGNVQQSAAGLTDKNLAYVMYTSGSTGTPKGVAVQHESLLNYLMWATSSLLNDIKRLPAITSLSFDPCLKQLLGPLMVGDTVFVLDRVLEDPSRLFDIFSGGLSALNCVPSLWRNCLDWLEKHPSGSTRNLVRILLGGEQIIPDLIRRSIGLLPGTQISNLYGPTETTANSVVASSISAEDICIGRPVANTQAYVCDAFMQPVPLGVVGELYIGGAGLARGYLNRPELTAEKFLPDPFNCKPGSRLYRTGDQVSWRADGNLEFMGRNDDQIKIRGCRVELGEIESRLLEHASIRETVVVAQEDNLGEKRLIAYYTCQKSWKTEREEQTVETTEEAVNASTLWAHLAAKLPDYMVPVAYVSLPALPLTDNGKLDRKRLPAPQGAAYVLGRYEDPQGAVETTLAGIWSEVLKVEKVGRHDNFFHLGGHSLLAVRMIAQVTRQLNVQATITDVFTYPILRSFADHIIQRLLEQFDAADLEPVLRMMQNSSSS